MSSLTHLDESGRARMVDVSGKAVTERSATAEGFIAMAPETLDLILAGNAPKGDVLATARIAGIMAAKRTPELIPLCHPLPLTQVTVDFTPTREPTGLRVEATAKKVLAAIAEGDVLRTNLAALRRLLKVTPADTVAARRRLADATVARRMFVFA